jgi:NAD-dependent deacetylase
MPVIAKESGATVIEINPEPTALTGRISDLLLMGSAGDTMIRLLDDVKQLTLHAQR